MSNLARFVALILFAILPQASAQPAVPPNPSAEPGDLKVMSFNVRFGTAKDGEDHWDKRKDLLAASIRKHDPDLLGTQETLLFQADYIREQCPGYTFVGAGRDDGKAAGEMAALFFRTERFEKLEEGHYWMSDTPDKPGSKGWDAQLPRVTTWVKLKEKAGPKSGRILYFFNTHFDHRGVKARVESAKMLRERVTALGGDATVIVTGDFNAGEASEPYRALLPQAKPDVPAPRPPLIDSYRAAHPQPGKEEGTTNGFKGGRTGARIDWILHTPNLKTIAAAIDHVERNGRFPSDHYPITATLR